MYKRYANPMELFDRMLETERLTDCVCMIVDTVNEETKEKTLWEFWLHKDFKNSWPEFRNALNEKKNRIAAPTTEETAEIVKESMGILAAFAPAAGGAADGDIQAVRGDCNRRDEGEQGA